MPRTCNIDATRKLARLIYGLILVIAAIILLIVWALPTGSRWAGVVTVACRLGGGRASDGARAGGGLSLVDRGRGGGGRAHRRVLEGFAGVCRCA